jgi:hypothetical protein
MAPLSFADANRCQDSEIPFSFAAGRVTLQRPGVRLAARPYIVPETRPLLDYWADRASVV